MSSYIIKVESHSRFGDIHFRVLGIVIVLGFFFLYSKVWRPEYVPKMVTDYFWSVFWVVLLLEIILLLFAFPKEIIEITKNQDDTYQILMNSKKRKLSISNALIKGFWWSYNFQRNNLYHDGKTTDAHSRSMAGISGANELYLNVLFELKSGENLLLFETLEAWETTANWPYRDQAPQNFKTQIKCFSLKKLIQDLEVT
jgi:hypothetical protein